MGLLGFPWCFRKESRVDPPPTDVPGPSSSSAFKGKKLSDHIYELYSGGDTAKVDIIFIHGLQLSANTDAYYSTWVNKDGVCWPSAWLGEDFKDARVLSVQYEAAGTKWTDDEGPPLRFLGTYLKPSFLVEKLGIGEKPIIFVGHSLGGLAILSLIRSMREVGKAHMDHDAVQKILNNIRGLAFYGTPFAGSPIANDTVIRFFGLLMRKAEVVKNLEPFDRDSADLAGQFDDFRAENSTLPIVSFYETNGSPPLGQIIVPQASAMRNSGTGRLVPVTANHYDIVKPFEKTQDSYVHLRELINKVILKASQVQPQSLREDMINGTVTLDV